MRFAEHFRDSNRVPGQALALRCRPDTVRRDAVTRLPTPKRRSEIVRTVAQGMRPADRNGASDKVRCIVFQI